MIKKVKIMSKKSQNFVQKSSKKSYPMTIVDLEEEVQDGIWDFTTQRLLEVDLVAVDHLAWILCAPCHNDERQVILDHRNHRMRNGFLFVCQTDVNVLLESL